MNQIKNLALLPDTITDKQIDKMETDALFHKRHRNITFKIIKVMPKTIIINVKQERTSSGDYVDEDVLIQLTKNLFQKYFADKKIVVHATAYRVPAVQRVNGEWIKEQMNKHNRRLKDICEETGINYSYLSQIVNSETEELSQIMKAFFWYYFANERKITPPETYLIDGGNTDKTVV